MPVPEPNNAMLRGGPTHVPTQVRVCRVDDVESTLKLSVGNGYDHFVPTPEIVEQDGCRLRVFEWTRRTYIAE